MADIDVEEDWTDVEEKLNRKESVVLGSDSKRSSSIAGHEFEAGAAAGDAAARFKPPLHWVAGTLHLEIVTVELGHSHHTSSGSSTARNSGKESVFSRILCARPAIKRRLRCTVEFARSERGTRAHPCEADGASPPWAEVMDFRCSEKNVPIAVLSVHDVAPNGGNDVLLGAANLRFDMMAVDNRTVDSFFPVRKKDAHGEFKETGRVRCKMAFSAKAVAKPSSNPAHPPHPVSAPALPAAPAPAPAGHSPPRDPAPAPPPPPAAPVPPSPPAAPVPPPQPAAHRANGPRSSSLPPSLSNRDLSAKFEVPVESLFDDGPVPPRPYRHDRDGPVAKILPSFEGQPLVRRASLPHAARAPRSDPTLAPPPGEPFASPLFGDEIADLESHALTEGLLQPAAAAAEPPHFPSVPEEAPIVLPLSLFRHRAPHAA